VTEHIPLTTTPLPVRLRVEDFFQLDEAGAFEGYGKTELIRGEVFYINAQHRPHARMKSRLHIELARAMAELGSELDVIAEATVAIPPHSAPEPDLVITSEPEGGRAGPACIGTAYRGDRRHHASR
jgi:Uma2 family endonuclease